VVLAGSAALAGDPAPTNVNGHVDPQIGDVVGQAKLLPDGSCELPAEGITIEAGEDSPTVEFTDDCAVVYVGDTPPPSTAPGGQTAPALP
jgi:hypothetical protein